MSIIPQLHRHIFRAFILMWPWLTLSCSYRFTNTRTKLPAGMRSIAVEGIFDTSRHVLPHDLLWSEIQKSLVTSGKVDLTTPQDADGLIRIHLFQAGRQPEGTIEGERYRQDPIPIPEDLSPSDLPNLTRAGSWTGREGISIGVKVELVDLNTGKSLLNNTFYAGSSFMTARASKQTQLEAEFLFYEEGRTQAFRTISRHIANQVVSAIMVSTR